ncbi:MAG: hypothetical protein IJM20_04040 [Clostridia bacterium]|nr:hypothetical protein [Clostridia bacterium]
MQKFSYLIIALLLLPCLFLSACGKAPSDGPSAGASSIPSPAPYVPGMTWHEVFCADTDFDNRFVNSQTNLVTTADAYYTIRYDSGVGYLYYFDRTTCESGPLCGKPECMHDVNSCNARVKGRRDSLNLAGGRLYFETDETNRGPGLSMCDCLSVALDGTDRRLEFEMPCEWENGPWCLYYHRGKFYGASMPDRVVDGVPGKHVGVTSWDAKTGEYKLILARDGCGGYPVTRFFFFGTYVYFCFASARVTESGMFSTLEVFRWDTEAEELETLYASGEYELPGEAFTLWVETENEIYIAPTIPEPSEPLAVYRLENGELTEVFRFTDPGSVCLHDGVVIRCLGSDDGKSFETQLTDYEGNTLYRGVIDKSIFEAAIPDAEAVTFQNNSICGDRNTLYYCCAVTSAGRGRIDCILRLDFAQPGQEPERTLLFADIG